MIGAAAVAVIALGGGPTLGYASDGPVANFNQGVEAYVEGRYRDAERSFAGALEDERLGVLAAWNLGRAAAARGDWAAAEFWWGRVQAQAQTDTLREIARRRLSQIDALRSTASGYGELGLGYDSNAPLEESGAVFEDRSAPFLEALASGAWQLAGRRYDGWRARGSVLAREYDGLNDLGYVDATASAHHVGSTTWLYPGAWRRDLHLGAGATRVGGSSVDSRLELGADLERPVPGRGWVELRYRFTWHQGGSDRDWLDGYQHQAHLRFRDPAATLPWGLLYAVEVHDREDRRGDGFFISYSLTRHRIQAFATARPAQGWSLTGRLEFQYAVYADAHVVADESQRRRDRRGILTLEAERELGDAWGAGARLRAEHFDSQRTDFDAASLERYDVNRLVATVFASRLF